MNEIFQVTELTHTTPSNTRFYDPWEVTYGPDDSLWITEAKNYRVYKVSPNGGTPRMILDISQSSTFLPVADQGFDLQFNFSGKGNPQGGLAGLAIHPDFLNPTSPKPYVYISYIYKYVTTVTTPANGGVFFKNSLVRFTYDFTTGRLGNPIYLCDTLPGSSDHNSQRIIIAPVNGTNYLFYANGDMGAGQFGNAARMENAQNLNSYEGKILRFNLEPDGDAGSYDQWIPFDNPFNGTVQSAIWSLGFRNNQGFAYATINGTGYLYGQSHGPFSDDEINIIKKSGNYGHPLVIGYAADGNYDGVAAGNPIGPTTNGGGLPIIGSEATNAASLANYQDPIYTFYPATKGGTASPSTDPTNTVQRMYYDFNHGSQGNGAWPSEAPSGLDVYTNSMIPGWKNSLLSAAMKGAPGTAGGRLIRLKLNSNGDGVITAASHNIDTVGYFGSVNRFRDLAFAPDGLTIFTIIDSSSTTSGPTTTNPINSKCKGCLFKLTFLGYNDNGTTSTLPDTINVATGATNTCIAANTVTINSAQNNTNIWVPITDTNSNIIAEIYANGNNLGAVTTSYYVHSGTEREIGPTRNMYLDRNITITPASQPLTSVKVRLYVTNAEYNTLKAATNSLGVPSGISTIAGLGVFKNHDACGPALTTTPMALSSSYYTRNTGAGANGYALQTTISSFSTFYFANNTAPLTLHLLSFTGSLINNITQLQWATENENGTKNFVVERSTDATNFNDIGTVPSKGTQNKSNYYFVDPAVCNLQSAVVYYRLKIFDVDGKFSYSDIVTINLPGIAGNIIVHPNPVVNTATIEVAAVASENANWQLVDNMGRIVMQKSIFLVRGENTFTINMGSLPTGIYYLKLAGTIINQQVKFEKL